MNDTNFVVTCPHCNEFILIEATNCRIFRHGVLKTNGAQINPHSSIELCKYYIDNDKIYGCGKPFQLIQNENKEIVAIVCEYI
jgi:hypothetical protein